MNAFKEVCGIEIGAGILAALTDGVDNRRNQRSGVRLIEIEPRPGIAAKRGYREEPEHETQMILGDDGAARELEAGILIYPAAFKFRSLAEQVLSARPCAFAKRNGFLAHAEEKLCIGLSEREVANRRAGGNFVKPAAERLGKIASCFENNFGCLRELCGGAERFGLEEEKRKCVKGRLKRGKGIFCGHRGSSLRSQESGTQGKASQKNVETLLNPSNPQGG